MGVCGSSQLSRRQLEILQPLVAKHIQDPSLVRLAGCVDFELTSTERGIKRWEQAHLVTALDILNAYQRDRRAQIGCGPGLENQYTDDPRTRFVELLKRWLRINAGRTTVSEVEVRSVCSLCRDVLKHPDLFVARNHRSFLQTLAEVYDHLRLQLREVLKRDCSCAELTSRAISLGRNLISDLIGYLLLGPTDLRQTDALATLEVVALWQSLPFDGHPLPGRHDAATQRKMHEAWRTSCGSLVAVLLSTPWCVRLFGGACAEQYSCAGGVAPRMTELIRTVESKFARCDFKDSGLAGAFRVASHCATRHSYLSAVREVFGLTYLFGEILIQFHRLSDGLGDYGMVRVAPWLHSCLDSVTQKLISLKSNLEHLKNSVDNAYVLAWARGTAVVKPAPSDQMSMRAHAAIERAITGRDAHMQPLLQVIDELRSKSAPERLPHVMEGVGDAFKTLESLLRSSEFSACVGDAFPRLPALNGGASHSASVATTPSKPLRESGYMSDNSFESEDVVSPAVVSGELVLDGLDAEEDEQELRVEVQRMALAKCGSNLQKKDCRSLRLLGDELQIYFPGSNAEVKFVIDITSQVENCRIIGLKRDMVVLSVLKPLVGSTADDGVVEHKTYIFRFTSPDVALLFHQRLGGSH